MILKWMLHTPAGPRPPDIYTAEDCLVWPQREMCLTFQKLEAPGSGEAWQGWDGGDILLKIGERRNGIKNCRRVDQEGAMTGL